MILKFPFPVPCINPSSSFSIVILKVVVPTDLEGRFIQIPILCLFGIVSFSIYFIISYKNGNLERVFGKRLIKIIDRFRK